MFVRNDIEKYIFISIAQPNEKRSFWDISSFGFYEMFHIKHPCLKKWCFTSLE